MGKFFNIYALVIGAACVVALLVPTLIMLGFALHGLGVA